VIRGAHALDRVAMLAEYEYVMAVQVHRANAVTRVDIRVRHPVSLTGHKNWDSWERLAIDIGVEPKFSIAPTRVVVYLGQSVMASTLVLC